tara:strand:+ start:129 stop:1076 length:948 start_codon:yes stop_codon:yes gene_type:complete
MEIRYGRKRNGIKRELNKKIDEWLKSIDDEAIVKAIEKDVIITGGAIASMLLGESVNDFDVYFRTKETAKMVAEYYVVKFNQNVVLKTEGRIPSCAPTVKEEEISNIKGDLEDRVVIHMKSSGVAAEIQGTYSYFESASDDELKDFAESILENSGDDSKGMYRPVFMSQNAITLSHKIQLIIRFFGEPDAIHNNYDFVHAMCFYDYDSGLLNLPAEALEALLSRTLIYKGSLYPIASIFRAKKFIERGWRVTAGQLLKIMWQISELDLTDHSILREQLTGVDMAYMHQLIEALEHVDPEKMNSTYIAEIIERIFD